MTPIAAQWYDGKSSRAHPVSLDADAHSLRVVGDGIDFTRPLADVKPSSRVGNTRRHLYFADGSQCETDDNDAVDAMFAAVRAQAPARLIHRFESRMSYVLLACALTAVMLWAGVTYVIPAAAKHIALGLPASVERSLGRDALATLDRVVLEPTKLPPPRQAEMQALFAGMASGLPDAGAYRLELRSSPRIGPNAFALPSGIVIVTDALVTLARSDAELTAVLAHEIGHLVHRHSLRRMLQGSATALLIVIVTGDVGSIMSLAATVPTMLLESSYSRDFEREADDFALQFLQARGISTEVFAEILLRMKEKSGGEGDAPDYLSSHPATRERARKAGR
jgi:Zn-dependent protease with chaperone function